jgi:hypothetical protein
MSGFARTTDAAAQRGRLELAIREWQRQLLAKQEEPVLPKRDA